MTDQGGGVTVSFDPPTARAGEWSRWLLRYQVGADGMAKGGGIRVQLPDSWHLWRRCSAKGMQSQDPSRPNYVSARLSRADVGVRCEVEGGTTDEYVKSSRPGIDGTPHWFAFVTRVTVEGALQPGDVIEIVYGDVSGGSRGFVGPLTVEGPEPVQVAVDSSGAGTHQILASDRSPRIQAIANTAAELIATAPSVVAVGETAELHLAVLDAEGNRATQFSGPISIDISEGGAEIASSVDMGLAHRGIRRIPFRATTAGTIRFRVRAADTFAVVSNPVDCQPKVSQRIFWGDLHSHADHSFDAIGRSPYEYARDVAALDFYALSEHAEWWSDGTWQSLRDRVRRLNEPGRFVTILGYEATFGHPWGHHNVYFRSDDGPVLGADRGTLLDLWDALQAGQALTVPHHTGVRFATWATGHIPGTVTPNPDWRHHNPTFRRLIEIYSAHGQSEAYDVAHPLSYDNCPFTFNTSSDGPHYAHDAWRLGHQLGVIGSSDDHRGQPGRGEYGLAAVSAPTLDRVAIFDALSERRAYATTGARILLSFSVDGVPMGGCRTSNRPAAIRLRVNGTSALDAVELVRGDLINGEIGVVHRWAPGTLDLEAEWTDDRPPGRGFYYARVRQHEPYRERVSMAWSSPVWIESSKEGVAV